METQSLKIPAPYLPSRVERYWNTNLWPENSDNILTSCMWHYASQRTLLPVVAQPQSEFGSGEGNKKYEWTEVLGPHTNSTQIATTHISHSRSLSRSCTLRVLTQILHKRKWREANTNLPHGTLGETVVPSQPLQSHTFFSANPLLTNHTRHNCDTVAPDGTASITRAEISVDSTSTSSRRVRWSSVLLRTSARRDDCPLLTSEQAVAPAARGSKHAKREEQGGESLEAPVLSHTSWALPRDPWTGYTQKMLPFQKAWLKANCPK